MNDLALRSSSLNLISICTGGGGLDLGVELAIPNARSVCMVEREAFGVTQLVSAMQQGLLGQAPVWSDARTFDGRAWRGAVDGLIGGIPCQPHSLAGKRLERADPRDLWSTARRIIVQSGAWFVLIENVAGMLSSGGAERVHRDLGRLGFAREVGLFTASEVGASHQRERTFILGVADRDGEHDDRARLQRQGWRGQPSDGRIELADSNDPRSQGRRDGDRALGRQDPERHAGLGGRELVDAQSVGRREGRPEPIVWGGRGATSGASSELAVAHGSGQPSVGISDSGRRGNAHRLHARGNFDGRDPALFPPGPGDGAGWAEALSRSPELEPAFRRVADGLASRLDTARVDRLRMLGNGVVPLQAAYAVRTLATRLASRGSAGAARLVRMMEAQP